MSDMPKEQPILKILYGILAADLPRVTDHYVADPNTIYVSFRFSLTPAQITQLRSLNVFARETPIERRYMLKFIPSPDGEQ